MFSELFANLSVAAQRCSSNRGSVPFGQSSQQISGQIERLSSMFEPSLAGLLTQMATAEPPRQRDTIMQDTGQNVGTSGSILEPSFPSQRNGNGNVSSCWRSLGDVSPPAQSDAGLYASEVTRLSVCMHILHAWRHDASTQKLLTLVDQRSSSVFASCSASSLYGRGSDIVKAATGAAAVSQASGTISDLVTLARTRVNVLCTVFVHTCQELLAMQLVNRPRIGIDQNLGNAPHLEFEGTREHFRHVLFVVEVSLHLLQSHLSLLLLGGAGAAPAPGAPRLPLVMQYLKVLQQLTSAVGGKVALAERLSAGGTSASTSSTPGAFAAVRAVDLAYAARAAARVEQSLLELQRL
jgi:hypothetical protein